MIAIAAVALTFFSRYGEAPPSLYPIFLRLFVFNDFHEALALSLTLLVALRWPAVGRPVAGLAVWASAYPGRLCALAFVLLAAGARLVYQAHPLSMDEYAPLMQAHAFAQGNWGAHYPPDLLDRIVFPGFRGLFLLVDPGQGLTVSAYWPGLALLLTPFVWLHLEWCLNPALTTLALALIGDLAVQASGRQSARGWAMLAALGSAAFTVNAMSFYAMPGLLALNLLYLWLLLRPRRGAAFGAGLVGGLALVMHNPVPHVLMALPCLIWLFIDRRRWSRLALVLLGYLPLVALLGLGWTWLTASWGLSPNIARAGAEHLGGLARWSAALGRLFHWPNEDVLQARWLGTWKLWIWSCPGLLLLLFWPRPGPAQAAGSGTRLQCWRLAWEGLLQRQRRGAIEGLLLAALVLTYAFYFLIIYDQGHGWGYRYVHPVWGVLPIAAGLWIARGGMPARAFGGAVIAAGLLATPVFLWETRATIAHALAQRIPVPDEGRWVVFVAPQERYWVDLVQNLPGQGRVLTLIGQGEAQDRALMARRFPLAQEQVRNEHGSAWRLPEVVPRATGSAETN